MPPQRHILNALKSITQAQQELARKVERHDKKLDAHTQDIARLEEQIVELRNQAIQAEVRSGVPSKDVASKYGVTPSRVSQIAPRRRAG